MQEHKWWQTGVIYQVYPRSFQDSNSDGVGDLKGIISRLDYLQWMGVTAVWLSPIYPSPMADYGYDISDYCGIHPLFGNMGDFDVLLAEVHVRGMKLVLDLVPNHTSDEHPWFLESKSSRNNPKRDWYIWKDANENGNPPNNWLSVFGGSGWEWDEPTGQFYYHAFLKEQPDLNWRNPEVQRAMMAVMRYWLDKGVDGFRVDVMWHMIKDEKLRNNPANPNYEEYMADYERLLPVFSTDQPEVHSIVKMMRNVLDEYADRMMIGEIYLPISRLVSYYGTNGDGAHLPFNFMLISLPWNSEAISSAVNEYEGLLPECGWPNWVLGNHDQSRITSRIGKSQARMAAMLLLTLRGTPTIYYGDEIGMRDVPIPDEEVQDPQGLNMPGKHLSRDPARTPMQWAASAHSGFSETKPWLRVSRDYAYRNVKEQQGRSHSTLNFYRRLIHLRQGEPSLMWGSFTPVFTNHQAMAYIRQAEGHSRFLIVLNFTHRPCYFHLPEFKFKGTVKIATIPELEGETIEDTLNLYGDEGVVIRLDD